MLETNKPVIQITVYVWIYVIIDKAKQNLEFYSLIYILRISYSYFKAPCFISSFIHKRSVASVLLKGLTNTASCSIKYKNIKGAYIILILYTYFHSTFWSKNTLYTVFFLYVHLSVKHFVWVPSECSNLTA